MHEYLHLVAALGANPEPLPPQLFVNPGEIEAVNKKFDLSEIERPLLGLNPGAEYGPAKRWPVEKFIAAAREIQKRTNCTWLIFRQGKVCDVSAIAKSGSRNRREHATKFSVRHPQFGTWPEKPPCAN